jgi:tetratricopeptide (TPR) repeat protein
MSVNPKLQPPLQPRIFASDPSASRYKLIALIVFIILAFVAIAVVVILPGRFSRQREHAQVTPDAALVQSQAQAAEESASKAREAQELLQKTLNLKARLDNEGVKRWGAEPVDTSYSQVLALLAEANVYLDDQRFDQAVKSYRETIVKLEQLAASRPERIRRAMQAGNEALEQLDSELAKQSYEIALAADYDNSEARTRLQRAENLPQVLAYLAQGQFHEDEGDLDAARRMYNGAISLDKDFKVARDHLRQVNQLILERDFRRSISDAISALNQNKIGQAKHALDIARNLRPDAAAVLDLEQQLKNTEQRVELQRLDMQALKYEKTEQWEKAVETYARVLKIDANTGFAKQGKLRAERNAELNRQVQTYLSNPEELQAPEHRNHARRIYETAVANSDIGPKFGEKTEKLRHLLEVYSKPVKILVQSDDMTDVTIYRVGRLGHFLEHSLKLQPGRYKALGTRSGYRDVMRQFTVPVDSEGITFKIYCKEKI